MPVPNQFYIEPAGKISQGLSGLGSILNQVGEKRQARELQEQQIQQLNMGKEFAIQAMRSGDPAKMREVAVNYPEYMTQVMDAAEAQTGIDAQTNIDFTRQMLSSPPEEVVQLYQDRIQGLRDRGRDSSDSERSMQEYVMNPEQKILESRMAYAGMDPEGSELLESTEVFGRPLKNVQRSVPVPGEGFNLMYEDGTSEFRPYSVEQAQAWDDSQAAALTQAERMAGASATGAAEATARQALVNTVNGGALAARESMPRIRRLEELADIANTGFAGDWRVRANRALGRDVAEEEEFMALSNQEILAAADSLKGALSDRENEYLEAVGPGIGKSREGNARIINNIAVIAQNAIDRQAYLKQWNEDGKDPSEFYFEGKPFNDTAETIEEGTLIEYEDGRMEVWRNGGWVDY